MKAALLLLAMSGAMLAAQSPSGAPIIIRQKPAPSSAEYTGTVQSFSHASITVKDQRNPYGLRTFPFTVDLRERLTNFHLDYGDKVTVVYETTHGFAIQLKATLRNGS